MAGDAYTGDVASLLTDVALERGFKSPYWFTAAGAEKSCMYIPSGSKGVTIQGFGLPIVLYNVQQASPLVAGSTGTALPRLEVEHRTLRNGLLSPVVSRRCQSAMASLGEGATFFWGTHSEFLALGFPLRRNAEPMVDSLYNVSQCESPLEVLASIRRSNKASLRTLDGDILPQSISIVLRNKLEALRNRALVLSRILPDGFDSSFSSELAAIANIHPEFCGTERDFSLFGTSLRNDNAFLAALSVLDAVGRTKVTSMLQIRNMHSRALSGAVGPAAVRQMISASPDGSTDFYFPTCLASAPELFTAFTCSRLISPINQDTNYPVAPKGSNGVYTSPNTFSPGDVAALIRYRQRHALYRSRAWIEVSMGAQLLIGEYRQCGLHGVDVAPCVVEGCGLSFYNLEQLNGFVTSPNFETAYFERVSTPTPRDSCPHTLLSHSALPLGA